MKKKVNNIVISKEYLDRIRDFAAIRPEEEFVYIPKVFRDLPVELQPQFTLRPISGEDVLRFADQMKGNAFVADGKAEVKIQFGEYTIAVTKKGLIRWDNYFDLDGNPVEYEQGKIDALPRLLIEELSEIITGRSKLTNEEILGLK